eukprot:TRINITY_DN10328_c0_g3_i1.p2 TRINITY_DN10328_c0_g3~~TRINITY_DN10328_c0_g3_i1.p2  ORF type:complete len:102 (-),score=14.35 TRINITY_DN10328_c0_g3_i1:934-1239(-)
MFTCSRYCFCCQLFSPLLTDVPMLVERLQQLQICIHVHVGCAGVAAVVAQSLLHMSRCRLFFCWLLRGGKLPYSPEKRFQKPESSNIILHTGKAAFFPRTN